ncbi:unnamed protein product, partial [Owenia fusiformis]
HRSKMADIKCKILLAVFLSFFIESAAQGVFDHVLSDVSPCEDICVNTFPLHTYEKADHLCYCRRGCRLFSIVEFVNDNADVNKTKETCRESCKEAYPIKEDGDACIIGCASQVPFAIKRQQQLELEALEEPSIHMLFPVMMVHDMYSNMVDKLRNQMTVSWSFYMQADDGKMIVMKSEPRFEFNTGSSILDGSKTMNYIDTNLAVLDNSATPNVKNSQIDTFERDLRDIDFSMEEADSQNSSDWLECIAKKTGLSRLFLSLTILCSALAMIWLCFTTAATAPDQKLKPQKLSIYGDLEYLKEMAVQKKLSLAEYHPQAKAEAFALPIKVKVEQV